MTMLQYNSKIEKSLENLRAMGLTVHVLPEGEDECYIFITLDSIKKIISRRIRYPNHECYIEDKFLVIRCWRM